MARWFRRLRLPALAFAALVLNGCNGTLARDVQSVLDVAIDAAALGPDATVWIERVVDAEVQHFAAAPDAATQAAFDADLGDTRAQLQAAIQNTANTKDMTAGELVQAWAGFVLAAERLAADCDRLGLFAQPAGGSPAATSHALAGPTKPTEPPLPLAVQRSKGQI